jgi:hypothetical protein
MAADLPYEKGSNYGGKIFIGGACEAIKSELCLLFLLLFSLKSSFLAMAATQCIFIFGAATLLITATCITTLSILKLGTVTLSIMTTQ